MKKFIIISVVSLVFFTLNRAQGQNIQFSQFYSSPMFLAPSFAGITETSRLTLNYRDQWPKIPGTFVTFAVTYDQWMDKLNSGLGVTIMRDQAGSGNLGLTDLGLIYNYKVKINRDWSFRPGVHFKYSKRSLDYQKLLFGDQLGFDKNEDHTAETTIVESVQYLDMAGSALFTSNKYFGGFTLDHLFTPNQSLTGGVSKIPVKFAVFGGMKIPISGNNRRRQYEKDPESVTFSFHYRNQDGFDQMDLGAYWNKNPLVLGMWFRGIPVVRFKKDYENIDAIIILLGYRIDTFSFGYSYDFTISKLIGQTGGAHEISLSYEFNSKGKKVRKHAAIPCPRF